ncbi:Hypothetical protein LUCI_0795 [Lucifera butyrica]|uniref:Uncharacterized protein n=1 Tax=Lucifera butyrica TaxID=1351585 RepID=A0A498R358_9FIRM|nr:hypothetical protein [Lucifera butyrica]VBB05585.1 Hypothetical protein LUCI_0795 [Lucifera butyrica]
MDYKSNLIQEMGRQLLLVSGVNEIKGINLANEQIGIPKLEIEESDKFRFIITANNKEFFPFSFAVSKKYEKVTIDFLKNNGKVICIFKEIDPKKLGYTKDELDDLKVDGSIFIDGLAEEVINQLK